MYHIVNIITTYKARENAGYTQEKLAERVEVSVQYISDLERGVVGTSVPTLIRLCRALSVSSDYILMGVKKNTEALDLSVRLQALSPRENKRMNDNINLMLDAFHVHDNNSPH